MIIPFEGASCFRLVWRFFQKPPRFRRKCDVWGLVYFVTFLSLPLAEKKVNPTETPEVYNCPVLLQLIGRLSGLLFCTIFSHFIIPFSHNKASKLGATLARKMSGGRSSTPETAVKMVSLSHHSCLPFRSRERLFLDGKSRPHDERRERQDGPAIPSALCL